MALISCPECGKQISDQAPACIHCGYPLPKQPTAPAAPPSPDRFSVVLTACPDGPETQSKVVELLMAELGISRAEAEAYVDNCTVVPSIVLREGMTQDAAQALTFALRGVGAYARVVDPAQLEPSSPPPPPAERPARRRGEGRHGFRRDGGRGDRGRDRGASPPLPVLKRQFTLSAGVIGAAVLLYACNKLWFLPAASGPLRLFLAWYFSDLLAGALLLALVELLLALGRVSPIRSVPAAAGYLLACGLFLELAPLLYKPSSVCDPWDLLAYLAGGLLALPLERRLLSHSI